jgi:hypothetical protein
MTEDQLINYYVTVHCFVHLADACTGEKAGVFQLGLLAVIFL